MMHELDLWRIADAARQRTVFGDQSSWTQRLLDRLAQFVKQLSGRDNEPGVVKMLQLRLPGIEE